MSLILDALKKSEAERQRGQVPNLLSPLPSTPGNHPAQKKSAQPWLIVLVALLAILAAAYFYLQKQSDGSADVTMSQANPITIQASEPPPADSPPPATAVITETTPAPVQKPAAPIAATVQPAPAPAQNASELPPPQTAIQEAVVEPETRIAGMAEMPVDQRQQLPALKLSMHVYSAEASKRFAIIDGQRVNEGSVLGTAVVEKIRQDGVVLSVQGQSYLLPRP